IRDDLVTGVQTCALPISSASAATPVRRRKRIKGPGLVRGMARGLRKKRNKLRANGDAKCCRPKYITGDLTFPTSHHHNSDARPQIGRASCRERVSIARVA